MSQEIIQAFAQWPIVGVVIWLWLRDRADITKAAMAQETACAADRKESADGKEAMMREMLAREITVRDRELAVTTKVIADQAISNGIMAGQLVALTTQIHELTQAIASRKSQSLQNIPAVRP